MQSVQPTLMRIDLVDGQMWAKLMGCPMRMSLPCPLIQKTPHERVLPIVVSSFMRRASYGVMESDVIGAIGFT